MPTNLSNISVDFGKVLKKYWKLIKGILEKDAGTFTNMYTVMLSAFRIWTRIVHRQIIEWTSLHFCSTQPPAAVYSMHTPGDHAGRDGRRTGHAKRYTNEDCQSNHGNYCIDPVHNDHSCDDGYQQGSSYQVCHVSHMLRHSLHVHRRVLQKPPG